MKKLVFNHVGLWHRHLAECVEVALWQKEMGYDVFLLSCKGGLWGCPANPFQDRKLCKRCAANTEKVEKKLSKLGVRCLTLPNASNDSYPCSQSDLLNCEYKKMPVGKLVYNTVSTITKDCFFNRTNVLTNTLVENAIGLYETAADLIKNEHIDQVFVWNGRRSCDGPILYAAKSLGMKYSAFITHGSDFSIRVVDALLVHSIEEARRDLRLMYQKIDSNNGWSNASASASRYYAFASGSGDFKPSFGFYNAAASYKPFPNAFHDDDERKKLAIFVGTNTEFAGLEGYDVVIKVMYGNFYDAVKVICSDADILNKYQIVVRWHPNSASIKGNEHLLFSNVINDTVNKVRHILPADISSSYDLLDQCDTVLSIGSSMAVEALYRRKKCIFIGNNIFDEFSFLKPTSHDQLKRYLFDKMEYDVEMAYRQSLVFAHFLLRGESFKFRFVSSIKSSCGYQYFISSEKIIDGSVGLCLIRSLLVRLGVLDQLRSLRQIFLKFRLWR